MTCQTAVGLAHYSRQSWLAHVGRSWQAITSQYQQRARSMSTRARVLAVCFGTIVLGIGLQIWEHTRKGRDGHSSGKGASRSSDDESDGSLTEFPLDFPDSEQGTVLTDPSEKIKIELDLTPQPTLPPISGLNLPLESPSGLPGLSQTVEGLGSTPVSPGTEAGHDGVKMPNELQPGPDLPLDHLTDGTR